MTHYSFKTDKYSGHIKITDYLNKKRKAKILDIGCSRRDEPTIQIAHDWFAFSLDTVY